MMVAGWKRRSDNGASWDGTSVSGWSDNAIRLQSRGDGWRRSRGVLLIRRYRVVAAHRVKGGGALLVAGRFLARGF